MSLSLSLALSHGRVLLAASEEIRQLRAENVELAGQCVQLTTLLKDGECAVSVRQGTRLTCVCVCVCVCVCACAARSVD